MKFIIDIISAKKKALNDVVFSALPQIFSAISNLGIAVILARSSGAVALGGYALIISITGLINAISESGLNQSALKFASKAVDGQRQSLRYKILRRALHYRVLIWMLASIIILIISPWAMKYLWKSSELDRLFIFSLLIPFFASFSAMPTLFFQSDQNFKKSAIIAMLQPVITISIVAAVGIFSSMTLENIIYASIVSAGIHAVISIYSVPIKILWPLEIDNFKKTKTNGSLNLNNMMEEDQSYAGQHKFTLMLTFTSLVVMITTRLDVWLLAYFLDKDVVGIYTVAARTTLPLVIGLAAVNTALWPRVAVLSSRSEIELLLIRICKPVLWAAAIACFYSIFAPYLIPFIFGSEFNEAILLAQILCFRFCIAIITCPLGVVGYSLNLISRYLFVNLIQLFAVLLINIWLISDFGMYAAAFALVSNEIIGALLITKYIRSRLKTNRGY